MSLVCKRVCGLKGWLVAPAERERGYKKFWKEGHFGKGGKEPKGGSCYLSLLE